MSKWSRDAVTNQFPFSFHLTSMTVDLCACKVASDWPVFGSHNLTGCWLSLLPEMTRLFCGCQCTHFTSAPWPKQDFNEYLFRLSLNRYFKKKYNYSIKYIKKYNYNVKYNICTPQNSFFMTPKKVPNSDSTIITACCQLMIRWTETTHPKNNSYIQIIRWYLLIKQFFFKCLQSKKDFKWKNYYNKIVARILNLLFHINKYIKW